MFMRSCDMIILLFLQNIGHDTSYHPCCVTELMTSCLENYETMTDA